MLSGLTAFAMTAPVVCTVMAPNAPVSFESFKPSIHHSRDLSSTHGIHLLFQSGIPGIHRSCILCCETTGLLLREGWEQREWCSWYLYSWIFGEWRMVYWKDRFVIVV